LHQEGEGRGAVRARLRFQFFLSCIPQGRRRPKYKSNTYLSILSELHLKN